MFTGKLELLEIADATANFRKSIELYSSTKGTACQTSRFMSGTGSKLAALPPSRFEAGCDTLASGKFWQ
jgi:hypothetical protein